MSPLALLSLAFFCLATTVAATSAKQQPQAARANAGTAQADPDRVYLLGVPSLTFVASSFTTARRGTPRAQLACSGGDAAADADRHPVRVDCYNVGLDDTPPGESKRPKWHCVTALHRGVRISDWKVKCEGYSYPGDEYVLRGSCWLEYQLDYEAQTGGAGGEAGKAVPGAVQAENGMRWAELWRFVTHLRNLVLVLVGLFLVVQCVLPRIFDRGEASARQTDASVPLVQASHAGYATAGGAAR